MFQGKVDLYQSNRYNVIGSSASGKTTFARKLADHLEIPFIELDAIYWGPNWTEPKDDSYFKKLETALAGNSWVLDGNYSRTTPIKWSRVQTVIWLDLSFSRTVYQSITRAFSRAWTKQELWPGTNNRESFRKSFFSSDSVVWWSIKNYHRIRKRYLNTITEPKFSYIKFLQIQSHSQAREFLEAAKVR